MPRVKNRGQIQSKDPELEKKNTIFGLVTDLETKTIAARPHQCPNINVEGKNTVSLHNL